MGIHQKGKQCDIVHHILFLNYEGNTGNHVAFFHNPEQHAFLTPFPFHLGDCLATLSGLLLPEPHVFLCFGCVSSNCAVIDTVHSNLCHRLPHLSAKLPQLSVHHYGCSKHFYTCIQLPQQSVPRACIPCTASAAPQPDLHLRFFQ